MKKNKREKTKKWNIKKKAIKSFFIHPDIILVLTYVQSDLKILRKKFLKYIDPLKLILLGGIGA